MSQLETYHRVVQVNVDVQNDFCPGGSLAVPDGDKVVEPLNLLSRWTRDHHGIMVFTRDWHPEHTNHFNTEGGPWPPHCVAGTNGAEFHSDLEIISGDAILSKGTKVDEDAYSGFQAAGEDHAHLEGYLRPYRHERVAVIIGGLATDYCIEATVLDALTMAKQEARREGTLGVFVVRDAIKAVNIHPHDGDIAIELMEAAGAQFLTTQEILEDKALAFAA